MSSAPGTGRIPPESDSKITGEKLQHLLDDHLTFKIKDDTLFITVTGCEEEECPVPENVSFFYCRQPPCPK